jgi:hypothetical protein
MTSLSSSSAAGASTARVVPGRRMTGAILLVAGTAVLATTFAALPAPLLAILAAAWCLAVVWFSLRGTGSIGYTVIATIVKLVTVALIVWAIVDPSSPIGIRNGLYWIPLGLLNMGTGLWFLGLIRGRIR